MNANKLFRLSLMIIALLIAVSPISARPKKHSAKSAADAEFKTLIDNYYAAWSTKDTSNPAKYYAKDADLVFYDVAPMKYKSWAEYAAGVEKFFFETASSAKLTPSNDLMVTRRGAVAWTTLTFHLTAVQKAGGSIDFDARHTAIWEKRQGRWLIVHEHVSVPLPQ